MASSPRAFECNQRPALVSAMGRKLTLAHPTNFTFLHAPNLCSNMVHGYRIKRTTTARHPRPHPRHPPRRLVGREDGQVLRNAGRDRGRRRGLRRGRHARLGRLCAAPPQPGVRRRLGRRADHRPRTARRHAPRPLDGGQYRARSIATARSSAAATCSTTASASPSSAASTASPKPAAPPAAGAQSASLAAVRPEQRSASAPAILEQSFDWQPWWMPFAAASRTISRARSPSSNPPK